MEKYSDRNAFERSAFPEDWTDDDVAFLADFLQAEFGAQLVEDIVPDTGWDYTLFVPVEENGGSA